MVLEKMSDVNQKVKNRLFLLVSDKERALGERITYKEIAENIGVSEPVIARWMRNEVNQFDGNVIAKLCAYFACDISDLLYLDATQ